MQWNNEKWRNIKNWLSILVYFAWWYVPTQTWCKCAGTRREFFKTCLAIEAYIICSSHTFIYLVFLEYTTFYFSLFCILHLFFSLFIFKKCLNTSSQRIFGTFSGSKKRFEFCPLHRVTVALFYVAFWELTKRWRAGWCRGTLPPTA